MGDPLDDFIGWRSCRKCGVSHYPSDACHLGMVMPNTPEPKPEPPVDDAGVYAAFGRWMRLRRKHYGLTQLQLSESLDLTRTSICNIEAGRQRILLHDFIRIHRVLTNAVQQAPRMNAFKRKLLKSPSDAIAFLTEIGALSSQREGE